MNEPVSKMSQLNHLSDLPVSGKVSVVIPTLSAGPYLDRMISALRTQPISPADVLIIDSGSRDGTVERFQEFGARVVGLDGRSFNHGGTRRYGTEILADSDFFIFLTQDAIPESDAFVRLLAAFADTRVGMSYGRQLPRGSAGAIERHARLFNYSSDSEVRTFDDRARLGVKTSFCSNSFAAYRASALRAVGGFPEDCYFGEDQYVAGHMLMDGYRIAYQAEACVTHSHAYTVLEDFRRYFDAGVWHLRDGWLLKEFGAAEGEGLRFIKSEIGYLARHNPFAIPSAMLRTLAKFAGYKLGLRESRFSPALKQKLAMQRFYWVKSHADGKAR